MGLKGFEGRLERMVEGTFARLFRSGLRPVEVGRRLVRSMDDGRTIDVRGYSVAPNEFVVRLAEEDYERFAQLADTLTRELVEAARDHAREEGYHLVGPLKVELVEDRRFRAGSFAVDARLVEAPGGGGAGTLVFADGGRLPLEGRVMSIGRQSACEVTISDPNVSRRHAEIRPVADRYLLVDLGSTNGTRVNGSRIAEHELVDGDQLTFGGTTLVFEES
jgi:FhaA, N-terminal domain/FHA domain